MDYPYLMSREHFGYTYNNEASRKICGEKFIPITAEQALDIDRRGKIAGVEILRAAVRADNMRALAEAEAQLGITTAEPAPAPAEAPAAPVDLKDLTIAELREMAKKAGGFPDGKDVDKASRKELFAILQD